MTGGEDSAEETLERYGAELAAGVEAALPGWVERCVERAVGSPLDADVAEAVALAGRAARAEVGGALRRLLTADVDEQATSPLALARAAVRYPTAILAALGAPPARRDRFSSQAFPDDPYDLTPASFVDLDPALAEPALRWGAAKAFVHRRRHRPPAAGG